MYKAQGMFPGNLSISFITAVMLLRTLTSNSLTAVSRLSRLSSTIAASSTMSNITLYTWPTPNGIKASITLEELGLPYKAEGIDISTNVQKEEYELP